VAEEDRLPAIAGSLRAAEHKQAEDSSFVATQVEYGSDAVLVLGNPGVVQGRDVVLVVERMERLANFFFGQIKDGVAA